MIVAAAASIGLVTIGFQSTMATEEDILLADVEENVEAGNATMMMAHHHSHPPHKLH